MASYFQNNQIFVIYKCFAALPSCWLFFVLEQMCRGLEGGEKRGGGQGEEMAPTMYAHMNK
jgi:hypothetical protein